MNPVYRLSKLSSIYKPSYSYVLKDLYQRFLDGDESVKTIPQEEDPFWEPPEDVLIGTANVFLQSLSYALDFDDKLAITDYKVGTFFVLNGKSAQEA